jgi:hypothetical protein
MFLLAASFALLQRPPFQPKLPTARIGVLMMAGPPAEIARQLAPDPNDPRSKAEGGWKVSDVNEMWAAWTAVYGSPERAEAAANRNIKVLLPFLNTPATIRGACAQPQPEP